MDKNRIPTDKVYLGFVLGKYSVEIRPESLDDNRNTEHFIENGFEGVANSLINYHLGCIMSMNEQKTLRPSIYLGAGSDRGYWKHPWITKWELDIEAQLTRNQEKLLEGIVKMRNLHINLLETLGIHHTQE